jgi:biopolymer transport protein ExbB
MRTFFRRTLAGFALAAAAASLAVPFAASAQQETPKAAEPAPAAPPAAPTSSEAPVAPAPATPISAAPSVSRETVENPYGLEALWKGGDFVAKGTLIILVIMSAGSWYVIFVKLFEQYKLMAEGRAMRASFWRANSLKEGAAKLKSASAYRYIAESGLDANEHHEGSLTENIDLNTWVTMSVQRAVDSVQNRLQDGLAFLATVGSTAPFVGLFGTVWGIYHALTAIGIAGQALIDKVAGPVGEALIMTAIGLAVAVPAVLGYNWLVRRNKVAMESVRGFGSDLHAVLLGRKPEPKAAPAR